MESSEVWPPSGTTPSCLMQCIWKAVAAFWQHGHFSRCAAHLTHCLHLLLTSTSNFLQNYDCTYTAMDFAGYWISAYCKWTVLHPNWPDSFLNPKKTLHLITGCQWPQTCVCYITDLPGWGNSPTSVISLWVSPLGLSQIDDTYPQKSTCTVLYTI